jgi:hypothetical protein
VSRIQYQIRRVIIIHLRQHVFHILWNGPNSPWSPIAATLHLPFSSTHFTFSSASNLNASYNEKQLVGPQITQKSLHNDRAHPEEFHSHCMTPCHRST